MSGTKDFSLQISTQIALLPKYPPWVQCDKKEVSAVNQYFEKYGFRKDDDILMEADGVSARCLSV